MWASCCRVDQLYSRTWAPPCKGADDCDQRPTISKACTLVLISGRAPLEVSLLFPVHQRRRRIEVQTYWQKSFLLRRYRHATQCFVPHHWSQPWPRSSCTRETVPRTRHVDSLKPSNCQIVVSRAVPSYRSRLPCERKDMCTYFRRLTPPATGIPIAARFPNQWQPHPSSSSIHSRVGVRTHPRDPSVYFGVVWSDLGRCSDGLGMQIAHSSPSCDP